MESPRRSVLLPRLKESSLYKSKRKTSRLVEETLKEDTWRVRKISQRVSVDIDRRVVDHLKRRLVERIERRSLAPSDDNSQGTPSDVVSPKISHQEPFDIFSKYSDTGDILHKKILKAKRLSLTGGLTQPGEVKHRSSQSLIAEEAANIRSQNISSGNSGSKLSKKDQKNGNRSRTAAKTLPEVKDTIHKQSSKDGLGKRDVLPLDRDVTSISDIIQRGDGDMFVLTNAKNENEIESPSVVSPIQTPYIWRQESRDQMRISCQERKLKILQGNAHVVCPAESKTLRLYVSSGDTDFSSERDALMEKVYPKLQEFCLRKRYDLDIVDLHWGARDAIWDDHVTAEFYTNHLERCLQSPFGFTVLLMVGQRYGQSSLPCTIPASEFSQILEAAKEEGRRLERLLNDERDDASQNQTRIAETVTSDAPTASLTYRSSPGPTARSENVRSDSRNTGSSQRKKMSPVSKVKTTRETDAEDIRVDLLENWYKLDSNAKPPVYQLQNISSLIPGIVGADLAVRTTARQEWMETKNALKSLILKMAAKCFTHENILRKYTVSVLDQEIEHGLVDTDAEYHALAVVREFEAYENRSTDPFIGQYFDLLPNRKPAFDPDLGEVMRNVREKTLPQKISPSNIHSFKIPWKRDGVVPSTFRPHATYLDKMCTALYDDLRAKITRDLQSQPMMSDETEFLYDEVAQHVRYLQETASEFQGRKDILMRIKSYIRSQHAQPLVIYGPSGCGKTAVIGKAIKDCHKWMKGVGVSVVARSVGVSSNSCNIRQLLHDLNTQLSMIYHDDAHKIPADFKGLCNYFAQITCRSTADNPLVIFIDALDQLSAENDGQKLNWLPKEDHSHTRIILSTDQNPKYECLVALKKMYNIESESFLQIPELSDDDAMNIVNHWLNRRSRCLVEMQMEALISKFQGCRSPLFLKLALDEMVICPSYVKSDKIRVASNVKKMAALKFGMLERDLGEPVVRRCLGYIAASRNGLTNNEILDVLSIDEVVMDYVTANFNLVKRRFPPILLLRLLEKLRSYIMYRTADNVVAIRWRHADICDAAVERYHDQRDRAPSYHKVLAEYFLGQFFGVPKPYSGNEIGVPRHIMSQHLTMQADEDDDEEDQLKNIPSEHYNLRRLSELPHHLINSQQMDALKRETLCNFDFLQGKVFAQSVRAILEEIQTALAVEPHDVELKLLSDTLQLSASVLQRDPKQLAPQILGRLYSIITKDVPVSHSDPIKYPFLQTLFAQAHKCPFPSLIPSNRCLTEPGGVLFDLLSGHSESITAIAVTTGGMQAVTTSMDGNLKVWDLRSGRVTKTVTGVGSGVRSVKLAMNNVFAVTSYVDAIRIWSLRSSACVCVVDRYDDPAIIATVDDGKLLVAVFDGSNVMSVWNLESEEIELLNERRLLSDNVHKNNAIVITGNVYGDVVLYAARGSKIAHAQKARSGKVICSLECHEPSSLITALGVSRDYFIIACRQQYMKLHEIHQLELFDNRKATYMRSVRGCVSDAVNELHINLAGSHALAVCSSEQSNVSEITVWNLETGEHKHMCRHSGVSTMCACVDFRFCLTAAKGDNTLRIWNLSKDVNKPAPKQTASTGIRQIIPMADNQRYLVARAQNTGPITVWNIAKAKCLQTAVRIERGLGDQHDVVLFRKTKVVILTDRGFSSVSEESKPIFQTILVYDLKAKKYDKKVTGCFITPSPASEYALLEHHTLLGLSDNRTHFIAWNLWTGREVYRIRTNFKEIEKKMAEAGTMTKERNMKPRATTAKMTPWDRRSETVSARERRRMKEYQEEKNKLEILKRERENAIDRYIISQDEKVIVASYYAHHLCVFNMETKSHVQVLEDDTSMLFLYTSGLTAEGRYLAVTNYDEENKTSYVTLWDCVAGQVKRRAKNEPNVCVIAVSENAEKVVFGKTTNELRIWEPMKSNSMKRIKGYPGQVFSVNSKIVIVDENRQAVVFAGDISVWDLCSGSVIAVFSPDTSVQCFCTSLDGKIISFGLSDNPNVITLKLMSKDIVPVTDTEGEELFGETTGDTTDEEDDDDESA